MKEINDKLSVICGQVLAEKGHLWLFGLFLREGAPDRWDLVIAAPWADDSKKETFEYIVGKLQQFLRPEELIKLSRIVLIPKHSPFVDQVTADFQLAGGEPAEILNSDINGMLIKQAYLFHSERPPAPAHLVTQSP